MANNGLVIRFFAETGSAVSSIGKMERALGRTTSTGEKFNAISGKLGIAIGALGAAAGVLAIKMGKDSVKAASDLAESQAKLDVVFGRNAHAIEAWADTASTSLLMSKQAALETVGTFGNLFQAFGIGQSEAQTMSQRLVELAADLASFNNTGIDDAILALRSGLSGETEPLKRYGVALTDARLKQEALNLGIYDGKGILDANQKSQAAYAVILKDTTLAQGDVARTADGYANTMRSLDAAVQDAYASIGTGLLLGIQSTSKAMGGPKGLVSQVEGFATHISNIAAGVGTIAAESAKLGGGMTGDITKTKQETKTFLNLLDDPNLYSTGPFGAFATVVGFIGNNASVAAKQQEELNVELERTNYMRDVYAGLVVGSSEFKDAQDEAADASDKATASLRKQVSAVDKLSSALDTLNGKNRSTAGDRLALRQMRAEGPGKTRDDKVEFALQYAQGAESLASSLTDQGKTAAARRVLNQGNRYLGGIVGGDMADRFLSTPAYLDRGNKSQRTAGQRYEQGGSTNYYYFGDLMVRDAADAAEQARRAARLKSLGSGRVAEAARYSGMAGAA